MQHTCAISCTAVTVPAILPADCVAKKRVVDKADVHSDQRGPVCCHHLTSNHTRVPAGRKETRRNGDWCQEMGEMFLISKCCEHLQPGIPSTIMHWAKLCPRDSGTQLLLTCACTTEGSTWLHNLPLEQSAVGQCTSLHNLLLQGT